VTSCGRPDLITIDGGARDAGPAIVEAGRVPRPAVETVVFPPGDAGASCGESHLDGSIPVLDGPVCAQSDEAIVMSGCAPLRDLSAAPPVTGVSIDLLGGALPGGSCTASFGTVGAFTVTGRGVAPSIGACGRSVTFAGLTAGRPYTFDVTASVASEAGTSELSTTCTAVTIGGVVVSAACDPFPVPNRRDD
jgi:hypothetical protein